MPTSGPKLSTRRSSRSSTESRATGALRRVGRRVVEVEVRDLMKARIGMGISPVVCVRMERYRVRRADRAPGRWRAGGGLLGGKDPTGRLRFLDQGLEMVPSKEPVVVPASVSYKRSLVKLPVAPANRPVPPVMVAVSTMERTPPPTGVA